MKKELKSKYLESRKFYWHLYLPLEKAEYFASTIFDKYRVSGKVPNISFREWKNLRETLQVIFAIKRNNELRSSHINLVGLFFSPSLN